MDGIETDFGKLEKKPINKPLLASVDQITALLEETKRRIENGPHPRPPLSETRWETNRFYF